MDIVVKRVQDEPAQNDGTRVLVDRVWPRGISKEEAALDTWNRDVAPSTELRKWYGHDPEKFEEFSRRYQQELDSEAGREGLSALRESVRGTRLTLLTASKAIDLSQAVVLKDLLSRRPGRPAGGAARRSGAAQRSGAPQRSSAAKSSPASS